MRVLKKLRVLCIITLKLPFARRKWLFVHVSPFSFGTSISDSNIKCFSSTNRPYSCR